jgi:hypothetical protein
MAFRVGLGLAAVLLFAGCKEKPCARNSYDLDDRPLPQDWAAVMAMPEGAAMCFTIRDKPKRYNGDQSRWVDVPSKTGEEAQTKWEAALTAKGWKRTPANAPKGLYGYDPGPCTLVDRFDKNGMRLNLSIQTCKLIGWTGLALDRDVTSK